MKEYSIGLDIGNASVGWAVIKDNYELYKFKKKNMWGVRLFDQAQTAGDRRIHRATARRLNRRRERIHLLQKLIEPMIMESDSTFFIRLQESFLWREDRTNKNRCNLFIDNEFTDSDYYKTFPTIYHLRQALMESDEKADPRLIYLALHHLIKYRGHFIYENQSFQIGESNLTDTLKEILDTCYDCGLTTDIYLQSELDDIVSILNDKYHSKKKKVQESLKVLTINVQFLRKFFHLIQIHLSYAIFNTSKMVFNSIPFCAFL